MHDGENARSAFHFQINSPPAFLLDSRREAIEHIGNKAIETDGLYQHGLIGDDGDQTPYQTREQKGLSDPANHQETTL